MITLFDVINTQSPTVAWFAAIGSLSVLMAVARVLFGPRCGN